MTNRNRKLQETAKSLGVSPRVLEQYLALKAAEVSTKQPKESAAPSVNFRPMKVQRPKTKA